MDHETALAPTTIVDHATCLACGCLCDDIRVVVEENQIVEASHACAMGRAWFLNPHPGHDSPPATIEGRPVSLDQAVSRSAEILWASKAPIVWGLTSTTIEAVGSALAIADRIGAVVDLAGTLQAAAGLSSFQRVGGIAATLGEVKDRADVVVFWRVDPVVTHPRHWERYSVEPRGRFVPEGRAGRFVIVVDSRPSATSRAADLFVPIDLDRQAEVIEVIRAMVRGVAIDPDRASRSAGLEFRVLEALACRLQAARYGAWFAAASPDRRVSESLSRLVRDLNDGRRFVALDLGEPSNRSGASSVMSWQAGAASSVDFGLGFPRYLPQESGLEGKLIRGEVDAVLLVADALPAHFDRKLRDRLAAVPTIRISPGATATDLPSTVAIDVARAGIEAGGTVARVDGVMLPLRPAIGPERPTDRVILEAIRGLLPSSRSLPAIA